VAHEITSPGSVAAPEYQTALEHTAISDAPHVEPLFNDAPAVPLTSGVSFQVEPQLSNDVSTGIPGPSTVSLDPGISPFSGNQTSLLNISPFEWYDLLAQDAITQIQRQASLADGQPRWAFDEAALSRRQSLTSLPEDNHSSTADIAGQLSGEHGQKCVTDPWNVSSNIPLSDEDQKYLKYYIDVVGPILDLFDPDDHFTNVVPHLAIRNVGLLKSILAVTARHMSLDSCYPAPSSGAEEGQIPDIPSQAERESLLKRSEHGHIAAQYYYETLQYLSKNLLYPSYADSLEILATSIMISTYEMFDSNGSSNTGDWERHLRGSFWIQRSQNNNGETLHGLRRAVWWAWLRQDTWAAFRLGRPTLTIWRPEKRLEDLNSNERATRILYIAAKCVEYAAGSNVSPQDINQRMEHGNRLLQTLSDWCDALPPSYRPLVAGTQPSYGSSVAGSASVGTPGTPSTQHLESGRPSTCPIFQPIWVHPRNHAGAMQMYHFAKASVLLSQPTSGGLGSYRRRQQTLNESLHAICGIARASDPTDHAMAFVNVQALFASKYIRLPLRIRRSHSNDFQLGSVSR